MKRQIRHDEHIENSTELDNSKGMNSVPNPKNPRRIDEEHCSRVVDKAIESIGGEWFEENELEFPGRVPIKYVSNVINNYLRNAGYGTTFVTPSERVSDKPTNRIRVDDPKDWYTTYEVYLGKGFSSSKGKSYIYIETQLSE